MFKTNFSLDEAVVLDQWFQFALDHCFTALYSQDKKNLEAHSKDNKNVNKNKKSKKDTEDLDDEDDFEGLESQDGDDETDFNTKDDLF